MVVLKICPLKWRNRLEEILNEIEKPEETRRKRGGKEEEQEEEEEEEKEEGEEEGGRAVALNLLNCLKEAISPVVGDIACQQNHV